VRLRRAGDVIPEVVERIDTGEERGRPFSMPDRCPACRAEVVREGPMTYCPAGIACPAQLKGRLVHYASRAAMDIDGLGEKTAAALVERGMVDDIADIYDLSADDLRGLDRFGERSALKLMEAIEARKSVPLDRFLVALGIPHVGEDVARRLARAFNTLGALRKADGEALGAVEGVGPETAASVHAFFAERRNSAVLDRLLAAGVSPEPVEGAGTALEGLTFVLTGSLAAYTRQEATAEIERRGGHVASSVSGNTDYVVAGENPGSKLEEARAEGAKILDESAFVKMLR
jgi:DNA ligase (NAD+)